MNGMALYGQGIALPLKEAFWSGLFLSYVCPQFGLKATTNILGQRGVVGDLTGLALTL
jgi:hypothetical protein